MGKRIIMTDGSKRYRSKLARETPEQADARKMKQREYNKSKRDLQTAEDAISRLEKRAAHRRVQYSKRQFVHIDLDGTLSLAGEPIEPIINNQKDKRHAKKFTYNTVYIVRQTTPGELAFRYVKSDEAASIVMNAKAGGGDTESDSTESQPPVRRRLAVVECESDSDSDTDGML